MKSIAVDLDGALPRAVRTILWADVVESVRLIEQDEGGFIAGWLDFVGHVRSSILPAHHGRLVKGLGDGILMDFDTPRSALRAAFALRDAMQARNMDRPTQEQTHLRMAIEIGGVIVSQDDVYGRSVNRVARLATLVGPDEICLSAAARDQITADLDADIEDLGECHVKHFAQPIRAYRVAPPSSVSLGPVVGDLLPALAVIPFSTRDSGDAHHVLGEVIAEELIRDFSQTTEFNVISRLSTTVFRDRGSTLRQIVSMLRAEYVLSGVYRSTGTKVSVEVELVDAATEQIAWSGRFKTSVDGLLSGRREMINEIATEVAVAVMSREVRRALSQRLSNLQSYTLIIAATALMHRLSPRDFNQARVMLEALIERAPRQALPQALLANWHVLRVQQGWSQNIPEEATIAQRWTRQAIEIDPHCSLALAVDGFVHTNLLKQFDVARDCYDRALESNPNDAFAWLLRGTLHAFMNEGQQAVRCTRRALALSPLDPHRYFYDSLSATAYLAAHQFDRALAAARRSLRTNRTHASTLRAMAVACWNLGDTVGARQAAAELLRIEPELTVTAWLDRSPSAAFPIGQEWAETFRAIGLPN